MSVLLHFKLLSIGPFRKMQHPVGHLIVLIWYKGDFTGYHEKEFKLYCFYMVAVKWKIQESFVLPNNH